MTRLLFYCHNVLGLGHITRSLQLAAAAADLGAECTVVTGCRALDQLELDRRVTLERIPSVRLRDGVRFVADDPELQSVDVMKLRSERILDLVLRRAPDAAVVDHNPIGLAGELVPTLTLARERGLRTRFIWGVPYVEGGPSGAEPPRNPRIARALAAYHGAIAYTDPAQHDVFAELPAWAVPARRSYAGWIAPPLLPRSANPSDRVVVLCGGGSDAIGLVKLALEARRRSPKLSRVPFRIVAGPLADFDELRGRCENEANLELRATGSVRESIVDASAVVARAGYNTCAALASTDLPFVLVPFTRVRGDQPSRARRLAELEGVWSVDETSEDAEVTLSRALEAALRTPVVPRPKTLTGGATRAARLVLELARESLPLVQGGARP